MPSRHSFPVAAALWVLTGCAGAPAAPIEGDDADAIAPDALTAAETVDAVPTADAFLSDLAAPDAACDLGNPPSECCDWRTICQTVSGCASDNYKATCPPGKVCEMAGVHAQCTLPPCDIECYQTPGSYCETRTGSPHCVKGTQFLPPQDAQWTYKLWIEDKALACDMTGDDKPDNALMGAKSLIGSNLQDAVTKGTVVLLFQADKWDDSGKSLVMGALQGDADPLELATPATPTLTARSASFNLPGCTPAGCPAQVSFTLTKTGDQLTGTENPGIDVPAFLPAVPTKMVWAATVDADGALTGHICGLLPTDKLADALFAMTGQKLPPESGGQTLLKPDVDSDGDGILDALSFSVGFKTKRALVTGMTVPE